jgi:oligosaccharide repeat unit polymerase
MRNGTVDRRAVAGIAAAGYATLLTLLSASPLVKLYGETLGFGSVSSLSAALLQVSVCGFIGLLMPMRCRRPSDLILWAIFLLTIVPTVVVLPRVSTSEQGAVLLAAVFTVLALLVLLAFRAVPLPHLARNATGLSEKSFGILIVALTLLLMAVVVGTFGVGGGFVSLDSIYEVRLAFGEENVGVQGPTLYAMPWLGSVMIPLLVGLGVMKRRVSWLLLAIAATALLYSLTATKTALFLPLITLSIALVLRSRPKSLTFSRAVAAFSGLVVLLTVLNLAPGNQLFGATVLRTLYIPVAVSKSYYEFFSSNPQVQLGGGLLSPIFDYPYELPIPKLIAWYEGYGAATNANGNWLADAFANFGYSGMIAFAVIAGIIFRLLDRAAMGKKLDVAIFAVLGPAVALSNGALTTVTLTSGLALSVLLVLAAPRASSQESEDALHPQHGAISDPSGEAKLEVSVHDRPRS